jgi:zinc/manganese transport system substrate-binding protein
MPRTLNIVAAENFWGSIVAQLAGRAGRVTSIINNPNLDPHSYESNSSDARAFATADYVVLNGAGYDAWGTRLISGNPNPRRRVLTVATLLGKKEGDNPHFWYSPDYVSAVMDRMEADLKSLDPADSSYFDARRQVVNQAFGPYFSTLDEIRSRFAGTPVASTESLFVYLANYLGLTVVSPVDFMNAVAEGNDPPAPSVRQFQAQITARQARVLVYNKQTATDVTSNLKKLATAAGVPVVGVTETIQPPGASFEHWFEAELISLENALSAPSPSR